VLEENHFITEVIREVQALILDLPNGKIRPLRDLEAPDHPDWQGYVEPHLDQNWLDVPWFFAETYFYRRVLEATGYFSVGSGSKIDPYAHQKHLGLTQSFDAIRTACLHSRQCLEQAQDSRQAACEQLLDPLMLSLWGNQADLSMWPVQQSNHFGEGQPGLKQHDSLLVAHDIQAVRTYLCQEAPVRVDIVLDNSGVELLNDLFLANYLLTSGLALQVILHAKSHPTFVSDAMPQDVTAAVNFLASSKDQCLQEAAQQSQSWMKSGRLEIQSHLYWTSPLAFWNAPEAARQMLSGSELLICKGDANYRRFLGDRHWAHDLPAQDALGYIQKPFLALRVCKSEVIVGLQPGQEERLAARDPRWMVNGRWGLIQFTQ
jgi:uncharacterized protein with ATP-grasp and redox domains